MFPMGTEQLWVARRLVDDRRRELWRAAGLVDGAVPAGDPAGSEARSAPLTGRGPLTRRLGDLLINAGLRLGGRDMTPLRVGPSPS